MNRLRLCQLIICSSFFLLLLTGCIQSKPTITSEPTKIPKSSEETMVSPSQNAETTAMTPQVETIIVSSPAYSGSGTFHQALLDIQSGDIIILTEFSQDSDKISRTTASN